MSNRVLLLIKYLRKEKYELSLRKWAVWTNATLTQQSQMQSNTDLNEEQFGSEFIIQ